MPRKPTDPFLAIIGKRIHRIVGYERAAGRAGPAVQFILFDDGETFLELEEQDYHDYHDCCCSARILNSHQSPADWARHNEAKDAVAFS